MSQHRRTTVCLFSSHPLLASELKRVLPDEEFRVLTRRGDDGGGSNGEGFRIPRASVYVVEARGAREATERLSSSIVTRQPGARILVIAEKLDEADVFPMLRLGTRGVLTYSDVEPQLSRALHTIAQGGYWVPRSLLSRFVEATLKAARHPRVLPLAATRRLSKREQEVLALLLENLSNKEIAKELQISSRTAKFHVSNLLAKHGVRRRADLILLAHTRPES